MVGPVGIHHPDLGDGGVPLLLVPEVGLQKGQVVQVHSQPHLLQQAGQRRPVHGDEPVHGVHPVGDAVGPGQGLRLVHRSLPALHGVDEIGLNLVQLRRGQLALEHVDLGVGHQGALHPGHQLDALESARWSNCPDRASTASRVQGPLFWGNSSS